MATIDHWGRHYICPCLEASRVSLITSERRVIHEQMSPLTGAADEVEVLDGIRQTTVESANALASRARS